MNLPWIDLAVFTAYLLGIVGFGIYKSLGVRTLSDFLVANRSLGFWVLAGTLVMTEFNPSTMVWMSGLGYLGGPSSTILAGIFIVGLGLYTVLVAKRWKRLNVTSLAELFELRYSRSLRLTASLMILFALSLFSVGYLKATSVIFAAAMGVDESTVAFLICGSVLMVTLFGGLTSVAWTDLFSFCITVVMIPLLFALAWSGSGGWGALNSAYANAAAGGADEGLLSTRLVITIYMIIAWVYLLAPWYAQRMFAAKTEAVAFRAMFFSTLLVTLLYWMVIMTGSFYFVVNPGFSDEGGADAVLGLAINHWLPMGLKGLFLATVFAICQTTMSSIWNTHAAMATEDIYHGIFRRRASERERFMAAKVITAVLAVFTVLALLVFDATVREINFVGNIFFASLFFAGIGGFFWRRIGPLAAWTSIILANSSGLFLYLWSRLAPPFLPPLQSWDYYFFVIVLPLTMIVSALVAVLEKQDACRKAQVQQFMRRVETADVA